MIYLEQLRNDLARAAESGDLDDLLYPLVQRFPHGDDPGEGRVATGPAGEPLTVPVIDNIDSLPVVEAIPLFYTHMALLRSAIAIDGAGNSFFLAGFQDGNWTRGFLMKVHRDGGTILGQWQIRGAHGWKQDAISAFWSGLDLIIFGVSHDTPNPVPADGRLSAAWKARIMGVWSPHGNVQAEAGGESYDPTVVETEPMDPEVYLQAMAAALNNGNHALAQAMARQVKSNSQEGTRRAIASPELDPFIVDEGEMEARVQKVFGAGGDAYMSHGLFARLDETIYGTVNKVLDERGFPPAPKKAEKKGANNG